MNIWIPITTIILLIINHILIHFFDFNIIRSSLNLFYRIRFDIVNPDYKTAYIKAYDDVKESVEHPLNAAEWEIVVLNSWGSTTRDDSCAYSDKNVVYISNKPDHLRIFTRKENVIAKLSSGEEVKRKFTSGFVTSINNILKPAKIIVDAQFDSCNKYSTEGFFLNDAFSIEPPASICMAQRIPHEEKLIIAIGTIQGKRARANHITLKDSRVLLSTTIKNKSLAIRINGLVVYREFINTPALMKITIKGGIEMFDEYEDYANIVEQLPSSFDIYRITSKEI